MYLLSFLYCRMPVTLAVGQKKPKCFHQAPRGGPTGKPDNTQRTVYNKYKNKHDNNHNHRTYNTSTSHKDYTYILHIIYHISLLLISRSDSSEINWRTFISHGGHQKTFKRRSSRGNHTTKASQLFFKSVTEAK